jgi:hypothetical protein
MVPPLLYLLSDDGSNVNNRRFRAALWDPFATPDSNLDTCGDPIAWPQLGGQAIRPDGDPRANRNTGSENG